MSGRVEKGRLNVESSEGLPRKASGVAQSFVEDPRAGTNQGAGTTTCSESKTDILRANKG
jgi:hypothetical protein